jgi:hypothetical protein
LGGCLYLLTRFSAAKSSYAEDDRISLDSRGEQANRKSGFHNNSTCALGRNIWPEELRPGPGDYKVTIASG